MLEEFLRWSTRWKPVLDLALTVAIVCVGILQWHIANRLHRLSRDADAREAPRLAFTWRHHLSHAYVFAIVNSGRRSTSVVDVQLKMKDHPERPAALKARRADFDPHFMFVTGEKKPLAINAGPAVGALLEGGKLVFFMVENEDLKATFNRLGNPSGALLAVVAATGEEVEDEVYLPY